MTSVLISAPIQDTIVNLSPPDTTISVRETPQIPSVTNDTFVPVSSTPVTSLRTSTRVIVIPEERQSQVIAPVKKSRQPEWNTTGNFLINNGLSDIAVGLKKQDEGITKNLYSGTGKPADIEIQPRKTLTYDWLLGIYLLLIILFVWIRIFYSKFFATLGNALISFHLSLKLFQERNVLLHRVSMVLDFIYIIVFSVFLFELIEYSGFSGTGMTGFNLFLLLLNITMLYVLSRILVLRMTGSLFLVKSLFAEYIHNTYVVNKAFGIALFPLVIMAHYLPYKLVPVVLILGVLAWIVAIFLKSFRAYQIIIRRDILLFYLILYLCTLEILPLLLGYKFVTSLIQSN